MAGCCWFGLAAGRQEKLAVNSKAVGGGEDDGLRVDERGGGEVGRNGVGSEIADLSAADLDSGARWVPCVGAEHGDCGAVAGFDRGPFDTGVMCDWREVFAEDGNAPEMTAIDVVLVGGKEDGAAIGGKRGVLDFEFARCVEGLGRIALCGDRI